MKIFDCFPFFNELEILELRFMTLYDTVDYFVIVEANKTHHNKPKEFNFENNKERYAKYLDKVIYIKVTDLPDATPERPWISENYQRNCIMRGLKNKAVVGDKILLSDLDEIPNPDAIKACLHLDTCIFLQQKLYYYYVNCQSQGPCGGTVMTNYGTFKNLQKLRGFAGRRYNWLEGRGVYPDGGWHYSYMTGGNAERIMEKITSIVEGPYVLKKVGGIEGIRNKLATQKDLYNRRKSKYKLSIVDISDTKPKSMDKFLEKYPDFFYGEIN